MTAKLVTALQAAIDFIQGRVSRTGVDSDEQNSLSYHVTNGPRHQQKLKRKESWNSKNSDVTGSPMHDLPLLQALKLQEANERLLEFETKKAQRY